MGGPRCWRWTLYVEGGARCREIVAGMVRDGLNVTVNGVDMKGFDKLHAHAKGKD